MRASGRTEVGRMKNKRAEDEYEDGVHTGRRRRSTGKKNALDWVHGHTERTATEDKQRSGQRKKVETVENQLTGCDESAVPGALVKGRLVKTS